MSIIKSIVLYEMEIMISKKFCWLLAQTAVTWNSNIKCTNGLSVKKPWKWVVKQASGTEG